MTSAADIVAAQWRCFLEGCEGLVDPAMARAAYAQPRLRELYPGVSHGIMFFSRYTGLPAAQVGGYVYPRADGTFWVRGPLGVGTLGEVDTLEEAFALVVDSLPEDCGPAIEGKGQFL
ncbi:DUF6193 family natural product biosynthesis protein [Streptomyces sp. NBC_01142]|uniref:DUF6193 family natural product biosynthesis protein n=1 Tax=Streptomyces sp. NBC_01142 TaxID=2975865 RepID=UPI00224CFCB3|nr:DUF6193 family natural product biosynthesis protein [Streptomyces sp. NBC_01142]MCX4819178.1 DUF6193 family natural product biosynthesis protein [Streptomyces sp. NBC_01142]